MNKDKPSRFTHPLPVGFKAGHVTVTGPRAKGANGKYQYPVLCDCGKSTMLTYWNFRPGVATTCGCYGSFGKVSTAITRLPEHQIWRSMLQRVGPDHISRSGYFDRGITVFPAWRESFQVFLSDVGERPSSEHTLDRIDNDGNYEPGNVRWATYKQQANNRRRNVRLEFKGQTKTIAEWMREIPLPIRNRIKDGWTVERALTAPKFSPKA